ncbi:NAD synthetase [Prochlorococcus phage P-SSM4]|uniref:NAD synthetase n=1 Tax=Prochlorococcus phage P-SSM4 TaxID=268747 RepID=E2PU08_BPPRS|nr:NAD synthetase [Prochlorococcus phage P-SSM4]ADK66304.1 NAD synthetase [Prochlorococcus phage P-SSM4]
MIVIRLQHIVTLTTKTESAIDYENPWLYQGTAFTSDDIDDFFGFVYRITNLQNGKQYIGRKYFYQKRKPKGGKRKVTSESNWKKYYGSSDELKEEIKKVGKDTFKREIISLHKTLGQVNYEETRQLFLNNVLTEADTDGTPKFYNSNILGRYMRKNYFGASD